MVRYEVPLDAALLFFRGEEGELLPPLEPEPGLTIAPLVAEITREYVWSYQEQQRALSERLQRQDDGTFAVRRGTSGTCWTNSAAGTCSS